MTRRLLLMGLLLGCSREPPPAPAPPPTANAVLEAMDTRASVPLLPMMANHQKQNMRDHLAAVQEVVSALAKDDFAAVERAGSRLGFSEQMGKTCTHMGAGAPGFSGQALAFHHTADGIATAAKKRDRAEVTRALDATLQACTTCHAAWKQQVVDEATWQKLTANAPPPHGH